MEIEPDQRRTTKKKGRFDIQISSVIPCGARDISPKSVDKDLVLVEFENDVWQPP